MDHRITIAIILFLGGTLGFTLLLAVLSTNVPAGAAPDRASSPESLSPLEELAERVRALDRRTYRWQREHGGVEPDFRAYPNWEQFLNPTDAQGRILKPGGRRGTSGKTFGPAMQGPPVNPLNDLRNVVVMDGVLRAGDPLPADRAGFVYSATERRFWGTDSSGLRLVAPPAARAPQP